MQLLSQHGNQVLLALVWDEPGTREEDMSKSVAPQEILIIQLPPP